MENIDERPCTKYYNDMKRTGVLMLLLPLSMVLFMSITCASVPPELASMELLPEMLPADITPAQALQAYETLYGEPPHLEPLPAQPPPEEPPPVHIASVPEPEHVFDPSEISVELYEITKREVQDLILDLNRTIRTRDFDTWVSHMAESYFRQISSRAFLDERSEELYRRDIMVARSMGRDTRQVQRVTLRTATDYFIRIVVPSRSNDHVDDIEYVSENRVKAYTIDARGNRLVLYDLEIIGGNWKIIN